HDSQVLAVVGEAGRDRDLGRALEQCGASVHDAVDLDCETGAGIRTVLVRTGSLRPSANPPIHAAPSEDPPLLRRIDPPLVPPPPPLPRPAPPLGRPAAPARRDRALVARRLRGGRTGPHLPLTAPTDRAPTRLRGNLGLAPHRHGPDRRGAPGDPRPGRGD